MKKLLFASLILMSAAFSANAQKGSILLYGNVGFTSTTPPVGDGTTSFNLTPGIGYQFNDNWTAGLNFNVETVTDQPTVFGVGPFIRYAKPLSDIFSVYGQFDATYTSYGNSVNGFGAKIWPAIGVNVHNGLALNFGFGSLGYSSVGASGAKSSTFGLSFGSGATFGISKNFGGGKKK
ncbi:porin family protein [Ferruginibacter albus]|uniref:porin family protein n=1 Tax=Ferruginibacter albus TaxID=2875540 RepID=UPI001CC47E65|nr:porin family protein [Ferruginibacter albus]UAY52933.1 porin family protein [Ferruginibacter albus]